MVDGSVDPVVQAGMLAAPAIDELMAGVTSNGGVVLGEIDIRLLDDVPPQRTLRTTATVRGLHAKGTGALVSVSVNLHDADRVVADQWWRVFLPGVTEAIDLGDAGPAPNIFDGVVFNRPPASTAEFAASALATASAAEGWMGRVANVARAVSSGVGGYPLCRLAMRFRRPVPAGAAVRADVWAAPARTPLAWFECWCDGERVVANGEAEIVR